MKLLRTTRFLIVLGSLAVAGAAFPAEKIVQSQWATAPIRIDGSNQEWQDAAMFVDKGSKAEYSLRNDGKFLYILFVFKSLPALSTYEVSGMKVYYGLAGKKNKSTGFRFVKKTMTADELIANIEKGGEALTEEKKAEIRKQKGYMTYDGVPVDPEKAAGQPGPETEPATFRDKLSPQVSVVEFRIPLARLVDGGAAAAPGASIMLGFEWGGMTTEMRSAYMARMAASGSESRGAGGGDLGAQLGGGYEGSEGGGTGGPMGGRPDPRTRKHSFWIDVKLAAQGN